MNWFKGYAECYYCKDQEGPWILQGQKFICESCYEKLAKKLKNSINKNLKEIENENNSKRRKSNNGNRLKKEM